jgi:hypothetical protein
MKVHTLAVALVLAVLGVSREARAQSGSSAASAASAALPLTLELGNSKLDPESVRKAIELELKRPVLLDAAASNGAHLTVVAHESHSVTVSYQSSTGEARTRSIGIPEDRARAAEVIALLSGNLSRDEAAELLASFAAKAAPGEPAELPKPSDPPAREPAAVPESGTPAKPRAGETHPPPSPKRTQPSAPPPLLETPFPSLDLTLLSPVALYRDSERRIFAAELGLFYSHVGELHGAGLNLFVLRTERDVRGFSFGTFYDSTGGMVSGVSGSAILNRRRQLRGFEFSGLVNLGSSDAQGFSAAGLANLSGDVVGLQAAGLTNWAARFQGLQVTGLFNRSAGFEGLQAAGGVNWAGGVEGLQAAGILNRADQLSGVQAAGVVNVADQISGLQIGVLNVAGQVHGVQLGVVNIAKHVDGTSLGLVSVADNGRVQPVLWASSSQLLNAAAKFTVGPLYTQAGLGFARGSHQTYSYELGLGVHLGIGRFFLEPGVHYSEMRSTKHPFDHELIEYGHFRVAAGMDLGRVSPFAGAGLLQRFAHSSDAPASVSSTVEVFGGAAFF